MPEPQTFANHAHRPTLTAVGGLAWMGAVIAFAVSAFAAPGIFLSLATVLLLAAVGCLLAISRVYVTRLQDRIIKLEMRERCRSLVGPEAVDDLQRLETPHIVALRFASDAEMPGLLRRAIDERLAPDAIKRAIVSWRPDNDRT